MDFFTAMEISASGLTAERTRLTVASSNLANVSTTQTQAGGPYKRRDVVLSAQAVGELQGKVGGPDGHLFRDDFRERRAARCCRPRAKRSVA